MKNVYLLFALVAVVLLHMDPRSAASAAPGSVGVKYAVKLHEFEGCECESVCPCVFRKDTTFGDCRGISVYTVNGTYGTTSLKDVTFVLVNQYAGSNMEKTMGKWKSILYTSNTGTAAERVAIDGLIRAMVGGAFGSLTKRTAAIKVSRRSDVHEVSIGSVGRLRIHGIKSAAGTVMTIHDAPSPLAFPVTACAVADLDTFNDGKTSWSFKGRNGFYADLEMASP